MHNKLKTTVKSLLYKNTLALGIATLGITGLTTSASADSYDQTAYPVILVHGIFGYATEQGGNEYWYGIAEDLTSHGAYVYTAQVDPVNDNVVRGEELLQQIEQVRAATGKSKVNLICHSQGGTTCRYAAAQRPDLVASVTAIGTPNKGSVSADLVVNILNLSPRLASIAQSALDAYGNMIDGLSGGNFSMNGLDMMQSLSSAGSTAFNQQYPQAVPTSACGNGASVVNNVHYYSWGGTSVNTNWMDYTDYALDIASIPFWGAANDGVVGRCSTHLGAVINDHYNMNHLDEVNQTNGLHAWWVDPVALVRSHVNRLKNTGL